MIPKQTFLKISFNAFRLSLSPTIISSIFVICRRSLVKTERGSAIIFLDDNENLLILGDFVVKLMI